MSLISRHNDDDNLKEKVLSECNVEGAVISEISRRYGISPGTVYGWRYERKKKRLNRVSSSLSEPPRFIELVPSVEEGDDVSLFSEKKSIGGVSSCELVFSTGTLSLSGDYSFDCIKRLLDVMEASC